MQIRVAAGSGRRPHKQTRQKTSKIPIIFVYETLSNPLFRLKNMKNNTKTGFFVQIWVDFFIQKVSFVIRLLIFGIKSFTNPFFALKFFPLFQKYEFSSLHTF